MNLFIIPAGASPVKHRRTHAKPSRNAIRAGHTQVSVGSSRIKADILRILKKEGFILDFASEDGTSGRKTLHIYLKYAIDRTPAITAILALSSDPDALRAAIASVDVNSGESV